MISLHVSIYNLDDEKGDQFKVMASAPENPDEMVDVTEHYEIVAAGTDDGRQGFVVLPLTSVEVEGS